MENSGAFSWSSCSMMMFEQAQSHCSSQSWWCWQSGKSNFWSWITLKQWGMTQVLKLPAHQSCPVLVWVTLMMMKELKPVENCWPLWVSCWELSQWGQGQMVELFSRMGGDRVLTFVLEARWFGLDKMQNRTLKATQGDTALCSREAL